MVEYIYLDSEIQVYEITHKADENWEEDHIFFIVTEEGMDEGFYCPVCHVEGKRLRSHHVKERHEVKLAKKFTIQDLLVWQGVVLQGGGPCVHRKPGGT